MKSEISSQRPAIKQDAYKDATTKFPAGAGHRDAVALTRRDEDVPPVTAPRQRVPDQPTTVQRRVSATDEPTTSERRERDDVDPLELQALNNMEFGTLGGTDGNHSNRK